MPDMLTELHQDVGLEQNLIGLGGLNEAKAAISWSKQRVHDRLSTAELKTGNAWVSESEAFRLASRASSFFIGENPDGTRTVFGIVPQTGNDERFEKVPFSLIETVGYANRVNLLKAIESARRSGQISDSDARLQASQITGTNINRADAVWGKRGVDPIEALQNLHNEREAKRLTSRLRLRDDSDSQKAVNKALGMAAGVGGVLAIPTITATAVSRKAEGISRKTRVFASLFTGTAVTQLVLSACSPVIQTPISPTEIQTPYDVVCGPEQVLGNISPEVELSICKNLGTITGVERYEQGSHPELATAVADKVKGTLSLAETPEELTAFNLIGEKDKASVFMYVGEGKYYLVMSWHDNDTVKFIDPDNWNPNDLVLFELFYREPGILASPTGTVFIQAEEDGNLYWKFLTANTGGIMFPDGVIGEKARLALIPIPEGLNNLPQEYSPYNYDDGSIGLGKRVGDEIIPIPGIIYNEGKFIVDLGNGNSAEVLPEDIRLGENGNPIILGDQIENPTEEQARKVSFYFDGENWIVPEAWRNMRYTPELMKILGQSIPAVIEVVTVTEDKSDQLVSKIPGEITISDDNDITHSDAGDFQHIEIRNLVLTQRTTEKIIAYPGVLNHEKTFYQTSFNFIYLYGGKVHRTQLLAKGSFASSPDMHPLTNSYVNEYYKIGSIYRVDISFPLDTSTLNVDKILAYSQTDYIVPGLNTYYAYWMDGDKFYTYNEVVDMFYNSLQPVVFEEEVFVGFINRDK